MRVRLVVAVIAVSAVVFFAVNTGGDSPDTEGGARTGVGSVETRQPDPNPTLLAAGQAGADGADGPTQGPANRDSPTESNEPKIVPLPPLVEAPFLQPIDPKRVEATRKRLRTTKPVRTTWSDSPLSDVLKQLSEQVGITIALGPGALARSAEIKIGDPLAESAHNGSTTIWDLIQAIATEREFTIFVGAESVMLLDAREDTKPRLRYYDARDFVRQDWGAKEGIENADRLDVVLPDLLRTAAKVDADESGRGVINLRNGILIARQSPAALKRIGEVLDSWRAKPTALRDAYDGLMAKRHPTVSGAPPRRGGEGDTPAKDEKKR